MPRANSRDPFSPEAMEFMADGLADLPAEALREAAQRARNACKFMPTIAELRELARCPAPSAADTVQAEAEAVWLRVRRWCVENCQHNVYTGIYGMPDAGAEIGGPLNDRELQALQLAGGIHRVVCSRDTPDATWCHKAFCESYRLSPAIDDARSALQAAPGRVRELAEGLGASLAMGRVQ